jgi:hypothetical protein
MALDFIIAVPIISCNTLANCTSMISDRISDNLVEMGTSVFEYNTLLENI